MKPPYPWFGGKSRIIRDIWNRFGEVNNFVDPFFGSGISILLRPQPIEGTETVNDVNAWLINFWRAIKHDPEAVASHADWPVSELDLHARGDWIFYRQETDEWVEKLRGDPDFYDAKSAGWWVWGICAWIGDNWSKGAHNSKKNPEGESVGVVESLPSLGGHRGVHRKIPHLRNAGRGINRKLLGDTDRTEELLRYFQELCDRFRDVRICCGDWSRVCKPTPTWQQPGITAVLMDPPYAHKDRHSVYGEDDDLQVAKDVHQWCIENGNRLNMRIACCGYREEGKVLEEAGWDHLDWEAAGGYGSLRKDKSNQNFSLERVWFSPHCIPVGAEFMFDL